MTEANYIFSVNNVLHIEENEDKQFIVISPDLLATRDNFNDLNIPSQLRVIGGTWTDQIIASKILPHNDNQGYQKNYLTIGNLLSTVELPISNLHVSNSNTDILLNGKTFNIGNENSDYLIKSSNIDINNNISLNHEELTVKSDNLTIYSSNEYKHDTSMMNVNDILEISKSNINMIDRMNIDSNNLTIDISNVEINSAFLLDGSNTLDIHTDTLNISNNDFQIDSTSVYLNNSNINIDTSNIQINIKNGSTSLEMNKDMFKMDAPTFNFKDRFEITDDVITSTITSNIVESTTVDKHKTNLFEIDATQTKILNTNRVDVEATSNIVLNTNNFSLNNAINVNGSSTSLNSTSHQNNTSTYVLNSTTSESHNTPSFKINDPSDKAYVSINNSNGTAQFKTDTSISYTTNSITNNVANSYSLNTTLLEMNSNTDKAFFKMNKTSGDIQLGTTKTVNTNMYAKTFNINTTTNEIHTANKFEINTSSSAGYLKVDKNNSLINMGTQSTAFTTIEGNAIKNITPTFTINTSSDSANMTVNKNQNKTIINENAKSEILLESDNVSIGKSTLSRTTINGSEIVFNGDFIPSADDVYTIGTPEYKVKDLYVGESSIWLGDDHKFEITEGKLRFKKRNRQVLPTGLRNVNNTTIIDPLTGLPKNFNQFTLGDLDILRRQNNVDVNNINDLFTDDDFEDNTPGITWIDRGNDIFYEKGNVGIGTAEPVVSLHVNSTDSLKLPVGNTSQRPYANSVNEAGYIRYNVETEQFEGFGAGNKWGSLGGVIDVDQDTYIKAETSAGYDNDELQFFTSGSERMIIKNDGLVGIGTDAPTHKLHIAGDTRIEGNLIVNGETRIIDTNTSTSEQLVVTNDGTGPAAVFNQIGDQPIMDVQDSGESVMYIEDGGNIGIKTTDPYVSLHINTTDSIKLPVGTTAERPIANNEEHRGYIRFNKDTEQFEGFGAGNTWGSLGGVIDVDQDTFIKAESGAGDDNDELWFYTDGNERMRITSDGKVGVNTSNPDYNLDIKGDINYYDGTLTSNGIDVFQEFRDNLRSGTLFVTPNENTNSLTLGEEGLNEIGITADKINIGTANSVTTILGELIAYSTGSMSNVVINTTQQETSSFYVNNVGTDIAMLVKQDNVLDCNMDIARFLTNEDDNTAFRIDSQGKVGIGIYGESNINAWLYVNKKDPTDVITDMVRVDDVENDTTPFIIKQDGKVGINTNDPVSELEIDGETVTTRLTAGTISGALVLPDDAILAWDFRDEGTDITNYSTTSNQFFDGYIVNFNKRVLDVDSPYNGYLDRNLMLWYKFDNVDNTSNIKNYADVIDTSSYLDPDNIENSSLVQDVPVVKRIRGAFNTYYVYVDTEVILPNGQAYIYPNETDVLQLLSKIEKEFTFNIFVRIEDITLPGISLFSIKQNDTKTLLNISVVEDGIISFKIGDTVLLSATNLEELKDGNVITSMTYDEDTNSTKLCIYINGFKDTEKTIAGFKPEFVVDNVGVRFASEITVDKSPIFLKDIRLFERLLTQPEIYGLNGLDEEGKVNRNVKVNPESDYLMDVDGNARVSESLVLNNGLASKIFFASGGVLFMDTNNQTTCSLGVNIKWKNNLSDYNDIQTFIFRMSCNFHACTSNPNNALSYRTFSAFINPKDDPINFEYPKLITTTANSDTVSSSMSLNDTILQRSSPTSMLLLIKFRNRDNVYNSMRGYLECEFLASSELGVFEFETIYDLEGAGFVF